MLVDMEIPEWDDRFLSNYDPRAMAKLYARARLSSVMFACKNLSGLCFWPTSVGEPHPRIGGRDLVAETVDALCEHEIAPCAYYSVIFDNWASARHPDWRIEPVEGSIGESSPRDRHGVCCPNHPAYRQYLVAQIEDLYGRYDFDCAFCDMAFWPHVCGCRHCRDRFRSESGADIPEVIDWTSFEWCAFQSARERWIDEFTELVSTTIRRAAPRIAVYHNFAPAPMQWLYGVPFTVSKHSDFLGGDLYGDQLEQTVVTRLMRNLSRSQPVEYMTFVTVDSAEHVKLKSAEHLRTQVLGAAADSSAFMFIDAIDPVGTANPQTYDLVGDTFEPMAEFESYLGGEAIEDVAVYFSTDSKIDFAENGRPLGDPPLSSLTHRPSYPHVLAVRGASRTLQRAHISFGVITRLNLQNLDDYRVLVLPNLCRMDREEVAAIREFVRRGGQLYASRYTSLVETRGAQRDDFMLGDVFGVELDREERGRVAYAKPATLEAQRWLAPQRYLSVDPAPGALGGGVLRVRAHDEARVLATLSLPYGHPHVGDVLDRNWASIHSSPPWRDTDTPVIVERPFGEGRVIYSAFDIEREQGDAGERLFTHLVQRLLGDAWSVHCDTHPAVRVAAFTHSGKDRVIRVSLLNSPPALVPSAALRLRPPAGARFVEVREVPSERSIAFSTEADGTIACTIARVPELSMLIARVSDCREQEEASINGS